MSDSKAVWVGILRRQWQHRNHDVFGDLARRQINKAVSKLRELEK